VLVAKAVGRGAYARTRSDQHGFPRLNLTRRKQHFGSQTGDIVRAVVLAGKKRGTYTGRVAVRSTGYFNVTTPAGTVQGISYRYLRMLTRADGWFYTPKEEVAPPGPEGPGFRRCEKR
jgi:hypothetical protein